MNVVTGAFGYIGKYITRHLLEQGGQVRTITTHPDKPNPFGSVVQALPYNFDKPDQLIASLRGASVLYNTYWIRFNYGSATFEQALQNTATLFKCAREAGVQKIVHISVTQASVESDLPYYRGKALQEQALIDCGVPYSIVRPTLVYGKEDILVNNIAWLIRKFPVFPIFGSGHYKVQPVFVEDLARISVAAVGAPGNITLDAIGPETFSFEALVKLIAAKIKPGVTLAHIPPSMGILLGQIIGSALGDTLLTRDELQGLMNGLLTSEQAPNGTTRFSDWLESNGSELGSTYSSEIHRHFKWKSAA